MSPPFVFFLPNGSHTAGEPSAVAPGATIYPDARCGLEDPIEDCCEVCAAKSRKC